MQVTLKLAEGSSTAVVTGTKDHCTLAFTVERGAGLKPDVLQIDGTPMVVLEAIRDMLLAWADYQKTREAE